MKLNYVIIPLIIILTAGLGSLFTSSGIDSGWYDSIAKPAWTPAGSIIGAVWTILFLLMGISLYLVWNKGLEDKRVKIAVSIFGLQLGLNIIWSLIFFGLQSPFYAFIEIVVLWLAILLTIISFYKISKTAAYLLLPYLLWVSFASVLNFSIMNLN